MQAKLNEEISVKQDFKVGMIYYYGYEIKLKKNWYILFTYSVVNWIVTYYHIEIFCTFLCELVF